MNEKKLKSLAENLEQLLEKSNISDIESSYFSLNSLANKQKEYFNYIGAQGIVKLSFYIYSIRKTGNIKLGESMLNNIMFSNILASDNNNTESDCTMCFGGGNEDCVHCDEGSVDCNKCNGTRAIDCHVCDGGGQLNGSACNNCNGGGTIDCDVCDGTGSLNCGECFGHGRTECRYCDGTGTTTDLTAFDCFITFICTWDNKLKNLLELSLGTLQSPISEAFMDSNNPYLILSIKEVSLNLLPEVKFDKSYCVSYEEEPSMRLSSSMRVENLNASLDHLII